MASWKERSQILGDVVFFEYVSVKQARVAQLVYVWDLDKTYLDTHIESLRGLLRTIREKAFQKRNVPGTKSLLQALMGPRTEPFAMYFVTASPPQMEKRIREKLKLDNIECYGMFFKDNLKNLRPKRLRRLTQQVGYKLQALLQLRLHLGENVQQILWGDDSESDAIIYSLYSDICSRRLSESQIRQILKKLKVTGPQVEVILLLQNQIPVNDPVSKIYINLASDTDPEYYAKFGRRTLSTFHAFQIALDLCQDGRLSPEKLLQVAQDLLINYGFSHAELQQGFDNLIRRKVLSQETFEKLYPLLLQEGILTAKYKPTRKPISQDELMSSESSSRHDIWVPEHIDYLSDFR